MAKAASTRAALATLRRWLQVVLPGRNASRHPAGKTSSVEATATTEAMVGRWGAGGNEALVITKQSNRIVIAGPANDTWRKDVHDARIVGDSIHFVAKNYLHNGEFHPFNGVACTSVAKLITENQLELEGEPLEHISEILTRLKWFEK